MTASASYCEAQRGAQEAPHLAKRLMENGESFFFNGVATGNPIAILRQAIQIKLSSSFKKKKSKHSGKGTAEEMKGSERGGRGPDTLYTCMKLAKNKLNSSK